MTVVGSHAQGDFSLRLIDCTGMLSDESPIWLASIGETVDVEAGGHGYVGSFRNAIGEGFGKTRVEATDNALGEFVARRLGLPSPPQRGAITFS